MQRQLGNKATRELPKALGTFPSSLAAWGHRIQVGQAGRQMNGALNRFGRQRVLALFADWTETARSRPLDSAPGLVNCARGQVCDRTHQIALPSKMLQLHTGKPLLLRSSVPV